MIGMSPESCRLCLDNPEIARNCERCGWCGDNGDGQAGDCHLLNGAGERIIIEQRKRTLDGSELVIGKIVPVNAHEFSHHRISPSISVNQMRARG